MISHRRRSFAQVAFKLLYSLKMFPSKAEKLFQISCIINAILIHFYKGQVLQIRRATCLSSKDTMLALRLLQQILPEGQEGEWAN